jgi:hypothetical protein
VLEYERPKWGDAIGLGAGRSHATHTSPSAGRAGVPAPCRGVYAAMRWPWQPGRL